MSVGHPLCASPLVSLGVDGLEQCLWVTFSVGRLLVLFAGFRLRFSILRNRSRSYILNNAA